MTLDDHEIQTPNIRRQRAGGWTSIHSWVFLGIIAAAMLVLIVQNRYHYLSPLGLGKAYRIDKVFGGIQEFDPTQGWVTAQLQIAAGQPQVSMGGSEPSIASSRAVPMNMPGYGMGPERPEPAAPPVIQPKESVAPVIPKEAPAGKPTVATRAAEPELTKEEKFKAFKVFFPDFDQDEFQLANDDLYPDWKKNVAPNGSWSEFLTVYRDFIQWWTDAGSPSEQGYKLWKDFLAKEK